ncbi:MAG: right-handed parallel beta-helix repeat-containing protein [Euryarchaeota archaeon]|nr:right-handed parallel beta-helix repeat-containing protein [Euryarchaeota archaeon]
MTATDALGHSNSTRTTAVIYLPPVHNINNDGYYYTIQAAINDAYPGDTICVRNGTYYESIYISKPLTLIGENKETTIIDDSHAFGFSLAVVGLYSSSDIVIHQFTIKMNKSNTVIRLHNTNHATISDCIITTDATGSGIFFYESPNNIISQNLITHCDYGISLSDGSSQNNIYENTIQDNRITGIIIQGSAGTTINNRLYHNNFINNTQNAYDECNNIWYNPDLKEGNFWDDYTGMDTDFNGIGDTPYNISGGSNKDYYPLICPWPQIPGDLDHDDDIDEDDYQLFLSAFGHSIGDPEFNPEADYDHDGIVTLVDYQIWLMYYRTSHTDILISGITANYITGDSTSLSAEHDTATKIKLTATIKNNGTIDITTPFQVSFYGYRGPYDPHIRPIHLGTIEIPSLSVGETTEAILLWRLQPEIQTILAIADSSRVVKENNENNNEMSIKLPSYPLWKCLTETQEIYKKLNEQYKVPSAEKIITLAEEAISLDVYANPQEYLEAMKGIAGVEFQVGDELKGQVHDDLLEKYQEMVKQLLDRIVSSSETSWDDAAAVAELQVQICKHMKQMMT